MINNLYLKELYPYYSPLKDILERIQEGHPIKGVLMVATDRGTITVTDDNFSEVVKKYPRLVVDCWAPWCGPCKTISPLIEDMAKEYKGKIAFGKLNVDENEKLPRKFNIMSIPTLLFLKNGELVGMVVGAVPKPHIVDKIDEVFYA